MSETESDVIVKITKSDNSEISVLFGQMSPDNTGMYLKTSSSDDIYLVSSTLKDTFVFDKLKFADVSMLPKPEMGGGYDSYFENGNLLKFDSLSLIGKNYENPLVIVPNTEAAISDYIPYKIISPDEHYADKVDELLALFSGGVSVSGIYSYDVTEAEMTNFGFKTPDLTVKLTLGNKEFIYIFKAQEDGDYAAAATDGIYIYKVSAATVSALAGSKPTDYYSSIISLFSIDDLSEINITAEGKTYKFGIKANSDENAEDRYIITHDGKSIDCSSFQNFYQYFLMISCYDYNIGETNKDDYINVEFGFNNGSTAAVRFERADDTNYQYSFNSKPVGKVPMYKLTKLIKYLKKLSNGEKLGTLT